MFSLGSPVFLPPQKPTFQIPIRSGACPRLVSLVGMLEACHVNKVIYLFIYVSFNDFSKDKFMDEKLISSRRQRTVHYRDMKMYVRFLVRSQISKDIPWLWTVKRGVLRMKIWNFCMAWANPTFQGIAAVRDSAYTDGKRPNVVDWWRDYKGGRGGPSRK